MVFLRFGRLAAEPVGAVEHERRVPRAAVGRADRIGAFAGGHQQRGRQPRQRHGDVHGAGGASCATGAARGRRSPMYANTREARQGDERLEQLDVERQPERRRPRRAATRCCRVSTARTSSSSASTISTIITASIVSLREVITSTGSTAIAAPRRRRRGVPHPPHRGEQQRHRRDPGEGLGQLERRRGEAEQLHAGHLQPQVDGRLVDRDAATGLEGAEEEVVERQRHAAHGGVVEGVGETLPEVEQPQHRRTERDQPERHPLPPSHRSSHVGNASLIAKWPASEATARISRGVS